MAFGRRNAPPGGGAQGGGDPPGPRGPSGPAGPEEPRYPWQPEHYIAGNLAIGHLRENLLARVRDADGRVNIDILLIVTGAIAGYASLHAALVEADARRRRGERLGPNDLVLVETRIGGRHMVGDLINGYLVESAGFPPVHVMMQAAKQAGAARLPDLGGLFSHVVETMGGPDFGVLRGVEGHAPRDSVVPFLKLWPFAVEILTLPSQANPGPPLPEEHWPAIAGLVGAQYLEMGKGAAPPDLLASLFIQSALICAKVDPEEAEPGAWRLTPADGRLSVERLATS